MAATALSLRLDHIANKATTQLADSVRNLRARGIDVINLATARPNVDTHESIKTAAIAAIEEPFTYMTYTETRGLYELREAIAKKLHEENQLSIDPDFELIITAGVHEALQAGLLALVNPGDEVLMLDPSWVAYEGMIRVAGGIPVYVSSDHDGRLTPESLQDAITPKTKLLLITNPNNPTGTVYSRGELQAIAAVSEDHNLHIIVDEIYEYFVYDSNVHTTLASLPGMKERVLTVNGLSKAYAMTGWRIGYAAGPEWWIEGVHRIHQHLISSPCAFAQKGSITAIANGNKITGPLIDLYLDRRNYFATELRNIPGISFQDPEGACFFFLNIDAPNSSQSNLAQLCLELTGLMLTPGEAFGPSNTSRLRLSFASVPDKRREEVVERLSTFVKAL